VFIMTLWPDKTGRFSSVCGFLRRGKRTVDVESHQLFRFVFEQVKQEGGETAAVPDDIAGRSGLSGA
jgi:hypothetical protein